MLAFDAIGLHAVSMEGEGSAAIVPLPSPVYGSGGGRSSYHDDDFPKQRKIRVRVHAENDDEEQIVLNLIMEFARHVL